ncbi:uncharacterized protein LOC115210637 [Argonauta hians]
MRRCVGKAANIMLLMDSSSSIWIVDYKKQLSFAQSLVDNFDIGPTDLQVRMGAITFSDRAHLEFSLDKYNDSTSLKRALGNIPYRSGQTNTAEALQLMKKEILPKLLIYTNPFMAIIITDGRSRDSIATSMAARELRELGVHVYAIGVGGNCDITELKSMVNDKIKNVRLVDSYSALKGIAKSFGLKTCEDITTTTTSTTEAKTTTATTTTAATTTATTTPATTTPATTTPATTTTATTATTTTSATRKPTTELRTTTEAEPELITESVQTSTKIITTPIPKSGSENSAEIQKDEASAIVFGYDLISMGGYRANMITQFINAIIAHTGYDKFTILSFLNCPKSFNVQNRPIKSSHNYKNGISQNVRISVPSITDLIREIRVKYVEKQEGNVDRLSVVLFLDPIVTVVTPELVQEVTKLKEANITVFIVTIGWKDWPVPEVIEKMSTQPSKSHILKAPTYSRLVYKARYMPFQFKKLHNKNRNRK